MRQVWSKYRQLIVGVVIGVVVSGLIGGVVFERRFADDYARKTAAIAALQQNVNGIIAYLNSHPIK